ncbi:MFS transporter [Salipaludibacillus keqinensis]|uniref:MFS transporter n=1 Tax=Salipaludibacillus keqinensis TaxID=2045207 RepID=A0A323TRQ4_9BACI|nr:MFS transporter [Salipaludibacillus keqinensis]PYZ95233.1 MFS transporter [Salipaludibacillus keqinensis]
MTKFLYIIIVVAFLDTFIQLPIITPYAQELGASHILTGGIIAVYSLSNMIGNVLGGHWIDRFGRKKILLTAMILVAVILCFYPLAQSGGQLFVVRLIHGLAGGALIPAAFAYIGDSTGKEGRGKTMAYTGACIGTAAIIGPALGGVIASVSSIDYVFILVSSLFIITSILIVKYVKESYSAPELGSMSLSHFIPLLKQPLLIQACLSAFALMVSNGTLAFALPLKVEVMGLTSSTTGLLLSIFGIVALIVFLTPINKLFDRFQPMMLIITGIALIGASLIALSIFHSVTIVTFAMIVYGLGFAFIFPSMNRIVADVSTKIDRGKAYGIFYACFSLGVVAGSFISGTVAEIWGLPFLVSSLIVLIIGGILFFMAKTGHTLFKKDLIRS